MKRRDLLLATATISFAGLPAVSSAESESTAQTDPIQVQDVAVDLGGMSVRIGSASLAHDGNAAVFEGRAWSVSNGTRTASLSGATVTVENVDAETFGQVRSAMTQSAGERSLSPLRSGLAAAEVDPDAPVTVRAGPMTLDGGTVADEVTATGTFGAVTPENWAEFAVGEDVDLGPAQFDTVTVQRGGVSTTAEDVVAEPFPNALSVTAAAGTIETPGRSLAFEDLNTTFRPPEEGGEPHATAFEGMRRLAAQGSLTADAVATTLAESGVTVTNTVEAVRNATFEAEIASVTENGEPLLQDSTFSGTMAELMQLVGQRL